HGAPVHIAPRPSSLRPLPTGQKAFCCRIFTPAQPDSPAASVRDFYSGAYTRLTAIAWSGLIAVLIILYTLVDGIGARIAQANGSNSLSYVSWMFILEAPPFLIGIAAWYARTGWPRIDRRALLFGSGAGVVAYTGYALVLYALALAPLAYVSALRESSVLFAALLGTLVLGEPFGRRRVVVAGGVAFGLALVTFAR
ncbi:MAG: hypothetical protein EXQ88_05730, partial [Alphaproteobacteria bacterium]|nr:hypothetical protein [Alphaproteobacteria bacterium]